MSAKFIIKNNILILCVIDDFAVNYAYFFALDIIQVQVHLFSFYGT